MSRITSIIDPMGQTSGFVYDSLGRNVQVNYPNGFSSIKTFNDVNQIIYEHLGSGAELKYTYDAFNRLVNIENTLVPAPLIKVEKHEFTYDGLNRMLTSAVSGNIVRRNYDSLNRLD